MLKSKFKLTRIAAFLMALVMFSGSLAIAPVQASAASATKVRITSNGQIVDTFNGVSAKYIPGTGNSNTGTYCCAQYVKNYYSKVFGIDVYNMLTGRTPQTSAKGYSFGRITSGYQPGDIGYQTNSRGSGHWFIIKSVSGNNLTIIEQNWKWKEGSSTYAYANRVVTVGTTSGLKVFRLYKNGQSANNQSSGGQSSGGQSSSSQTKNTAALEQLLFNTQYYATVYADLRQAFGYNAGQLRQHYYNYGRNEGRTASPIFDAKYYLSHNPDVARAYGAQNYRAAFDHFLQYGFWEGRQGSPYFCASVYLGLYPDLRGAFGNNYLSAAQHFMSNGIKELRQASSNFSLQAYSSKNPDVAKAFSDPICRIAHYTTYVLYGNEKHRACL